MAYLQEESPEGLKVLFTGLDNAGKTSIILSLLRKISKIAAIRPTKGAQRRVYEFLGMHISEWDLGGQEKYRNIYLKDPDLYFSRTELLIYVIDIQNRERLAESLAYLKKVIGELITLNIQPPVYVFLHKYDPEIIMKPNSELIDLASFIENQIKNWSIYNNFFYYKTSIFNLSTIITAMSEIFLIKYPKSSLIKNAVDEFAKKIKLEGLEIIDDNSLILGFYYKNDDVEQLLNQTSPYFLKMNDIFEKADVSKCQPEDQMMVQRFGKYFLFKKFTLREGGAPYYFLCCKEDSVFNKDEYLSFIELLKEILYQDNV